MHRNLGFGTTKEGRREGLKIKGKRIKALNIVWILLLGGYITITMIILIRI